MSGLYDINMGKWEMTEKKAMEVTENFDKLRRRIREEGLLDGDHLFFARKFTEAVSLIALAVFLQYHQFYIVSALVLGLAWQQLGWMIHEYCHQQHFKVYCHFVVIYI